MTSRSRGAIRPSFCTNHPREERAQGNAGCPLHPQPLCIGSKHRVATTGTPEHPAFPAQWFYGLFRALPGDEFVLSPSSADMACLSPVGPTCLRKFNTSNGCQNHTALPYAKSVCRLRAVDRSRGSTRPAITSHARRCRVHRIPPRVRDDRDTPPSWDETAVDIEVIWVKPEQKYFCKWGWTAIH